jgi:type IV secretory pathway ATPase VirB11/archaellum biosynthesis ATPase
MRALASLVGLAVLAGPSLTSASVPAPPPTFVVVTQEGRQFRSQMSIYSSTTVAIVRRLASFSEKTFTNNGLAYAPDGSAVYFTLIPQRKTHGFSLRVMRLDVATGR